MKVFGVALKACLDLIILLPSWCEEKVRQTFTVQKVQTIMMSTMHYTTTILKLFRISTQVLPVSYKHNTVFYTRRHNFHKLCGITDTRFGSSDSLMKGNSSDV